MIKRFVIVNNELLDATDAETILKWEKTETGPDTPAVWRKTKSDVISEAF